MHRDGRLLAATAAVVIIAVILCSPKEVVDDAYVSLRASLHLAGGDGLVFNRHERVEAFSNLLWALLMVVPIGLGLSPEHSAAYGGVLLGVVATARAGAMVARHGGSPAVAVTLVALCPPFWSMAALGLEGGLYAWLLVELVGGILDRQPVRLGMIGGLLFMTRIESVLLLAPVVLALALGFDVPGARRREAVLRVAAVWLAIAGMVTLARYAYFGDVVPNSVRAKAGALFDVDVLAANVWAGFPYVRDSLPSIGALLILPLAGLAIRVRRASAFALLAFGTAVAVAVRNGGDWMPYFRLLTPYVPLLATASGLAAAGLWRALHAGQRLLGAVAFGLVGGVVLGLALIGLWESPWTQPTLALELPSDRNRAMAVALRDHLREGDIVTVEALGSFSYYAPDVYVHDFLGLADRHIAASGSLNSPWGKVDYRYTIDDVRPTVILLHSGYGHFRQMKASSSRDLSAAYRLFALCPTEDLEYRFFFVGIQREAVDRLAPALRPLGLCEIGFPT